jgi:hypothetical protein
LLVLGDLVELGYCELTEDKQYIVFTKYGNEYVEIIFKGMLRWRNLLTRSGRLHREVVRAIRDEWRETGKMRFDRIHFEPLGRGSDTAD